MRSYRPVHEVPRGILMVLRDDLIELIDEIHEIEPKNEKEVKRLRYLEDTWREWLWEMDHVLNGDEK